MANPTLIAQDNPWAGFTLDSIVEALLGMRGLTNDTTTGRTPASTADDADARRFVRSAMDDFHAKFPSLWSTQFYTATWTANDHSINLPANCQSVIAVTFDGYPLDPWSRDDRYRAERPAALGGGFESVPSTRPGAWRVMGYADADSGTAAGQQDYRQVLRLFGTPTTAGTLIVEYVALGALVDNATDKLPIGRPIQRWVLYRSGEMWGSERGDDALLQKSLGERAKAEDTLHSWFDGMRDRPTRATTAYPRVIRTRRRK